MSYFYLMKNTSTEATLHGILKVKESSLAVFLSFLAEFEIWHFFCFSKKLRFKVQIPGRVKNI